MRGRQPGGARDLRTVLFTDIVGSTEHATRVGDRAWGDLLARHHALVRVALRTSGGREMDTAGDGFFATFARPTEALACAAAIVRGMGPLGLHVRVGLHAGEVETRDGKAGGITVHVAARLMAAAAPDEILASATVRDLAAGAGWTFVDRGPLTLKGLAEPVHAYALDLAAAPTTLPPGPVGVGSTLRGVTPPRAIGAAAVVVGLVVVVLAANAMAGGGSPGPTATPTAVAGAAASSAAPAAASPTASASPVAATFPENSLFGSGVLKAATYTARQLPGTPQVTVADDGWSVYQSLPDHLVLSRTSTPSDRLTIFWPSKLATDACATSPAVDIGPEPERQFLAWVKANKGLTLTGGPGRQFGDLTATEYDVSVVDAYACPYTEPTSVAIAPCTLGAVMANTCLFINAGERLRLEVSSRDSKLILILIEAPSPTEFASFESLAEQVLSTLKFSP